MADGCAPDYSWMTPYLTVKDPAAAIGFYEKAFGFSVISKLEEQGQIQHVSMRWQTGAVMFGPEGAMGSTLKTPANSGVGCPMTQYVYCPDVDALTKQAKQAGAEIVVQPEDMFWGDRVACIKDPDGYAWSFATYQPERAKQFYEAQAAKQKP